MIAHATGTKISSSDREDLAMSSETGKPTLYERLGGVYSIATVVNDGRLH
jgi:hypothetical protein